MGREAESWCSTGGPPRWKSSWQSALLAASVLSSCLLLTGVQSQKSSLVVTVEPPQPVVGGDVTLTPQGGTTENVIFWIWYRGGTDLNSQIFTYYSNAKPDHTDGANYTGRETSGEGCFLHITNLALNDSGTYIVVKNGPGLSEKGSATIVVSEKLSDPVLWTPEPMVPENANVTLHCNTSNNPGVDVSWFKNDKLLQPVTGLSEQNRTLTLVGVTKSDSGIYTCVAKNPVSSAKSNLRNITVAYGPSVKLNPEGAVTKQIGSTLTLECTAVSVPSAQFRWLFNNTGLNVTGSVFTAPLTEWKDQGNYTCQAENSFTNNTASASAYVTLTASPPSAPPLSGGAIAGIVIGCIAGVALIGGLLYFLFTKTSLGRMELHASNGNIPSAPGCNQGVTDTKPTSGEEDIQYSTLAFNTNNPPQPAPEVSRSLDSSTIYSVIKKK